MRRGAILHSHLILRLKNETKTAARTLLGHVCTIWVLVWATAKSFIKLLPWELTRTYRGLWRSERGRCSTESPSTAVPPLLREASNLCIARGSPQNVATPKFYLWRIWGISQPLGRRQTDSCAGSAQLSRPPGFGTGEKRRFGIDAQQVGTPGHRDTMTIQDLQ